MPIYAYRCTACSHDLESLQRLADAPLVTCPHCGKDALVKCVTAAGFQLKGSGWYQTDFKSSGTKPAAKATDSTTKSDAATPGTDSAAAPAPSSSPAVETSAPKSSDAKSTPAAASPSPSTGAASS